jgi:hypothetical protein
LDDLSQIIINFRDRDPPESEPSRYFVRNIIAIITVGVLASWWIIEFTSWFEAFATLLALGGVFSWLAFVSRAIPDGRIKQLQDQFFRPFFDGRWTFWAFLVIAVVLLIVSAFVGSLQIDAGTGVVDQSVQWSNGDPRIEDPSPLLANGRLRALCWTCPLSATSLHVRVKGLPICDVAVRPWWQSLPPKPVHKIAPMDFLRPVVLVAAQRELVNQSIAQNDESTSKVWLVVKIGKQKYRARFDGHSVLIGCGTGDVDFPDELRLRWVSDLNNAQWGPIILSPQGRVGPNWPTTVAPTEIVTAYLLRQSDANSLELFSKVQLLSIVAPTKTSEVVQGLMLEHKLQGEGSIDDKPEDFSDDHVAGL